MSSTNRSRCHRSGFNSIITRLCIFIGIILLIIGSRTLIIELRLNRAGTGAVCLTGTVIIKGKCTRRSIISSSRPSYII